ncbi:hypothetical protein [Aquimarina aquimarini]|uniref:hypothetical protein n=1 Tax=Aquimarina aquimarini TaxID=1191734 RepID=UPI000D54F6F5|nr:hypothetical protein [Aquimarina aquimarini]
MGNKKKSIKKERRERVENFLIKCKPILNILGMEREIGVPIGTMQKFLSNNSVIHDDRISKIDKFLFNIFIDYDKDS